MDFYPKDWLWSTMEENRRLTLKVARAFPERALLTAAPVPNMRPFARMLMEIVSLEHFVVHGLAEGNWVWDPAYDQDSPPDSAQELFRRLDGVRSYSRRVWHGIPLKKLLTPHRAIPGYGAEEGPPLYWLYGEVENEIHHRGQGYAYLRLLGVEPPAFWDRA